MSRTKRGSPPTYQRHKPSGRARVRLFGRDVWLGRYGSEESYAAYQRALEQWRRGPEAKPATGASLRVGELIDRYLEHAAGWYTKAGRPTTELSLIRSALGVLRDLFGALRVAECSPGRLTEVRDAMLAGRWCRSVGNRQFQRVKAMLRWGVSVELVNSAVYEAARTVHGLPAGRRPSDGSAPRESEGVGLVSLEVASAAWERASPIVEAISRLQWLTGARSGEIVGLRGVRLQMGEQEWIATIPGHKSAHRGKRRVLVFGPRAQEILRPYLKADLTALIFPITVGGYRRAIARACDRAWPAPADLDDAARKQWRKDHRWHPHQLRHTRATEIAAKYGKQAARAVLGHTSLNTTQIYAEDDLGRAVSVMREVG